MKSRFYLQLAALLLTCMSLNATQDKLLFRPALRTASTFAMAAMVCALPIIAACESDSVDLTIVQERLEACITVAQEGLGVCVVLREKIGSPHFWEAISSIGCRVILPVDSLDPYL